MSKELFFEMISAIENHSNIISNLYNDYGFDLINSPITEVEGALLKLLKVVMKDEEDWIGYWMWELDFGKKWKPHTVTTLNGEDIKLQTADDLWNLLNKNM